MSGEKFASRTRLFGKFAMVNPCQKRSKRPCPQGNKGPIPQGYYCPSPQGYYGPCPQGNTDGVKVENCYDEAEDIQEDHGNEEIVSTEFLEDVCVVDVFNVVDKRLNSELIHGLHFWGVHGGVECAAATYRLLWM